MSEQCHVCGPVKYEAPTVICAPCAINDSFSGCAEPRGDTSSVSDGPRKADPAPPAGGYCEHKSAYQCANCALVFCMHCDSKQSTDREIKTIGSRFCSACEACPEDA